MKQNVALFAIFLSLTACSTTQNEFLYGSALGSLGALLGSQFGSGSGQIVSASAGALAGSVLGANIGSNIDDVEKLKENSVNIE